MDFLRVVAAFGVLFSHADLNLFSNDLFIGASFGHKLVMIFFVLSGFLIAFTVHKKNKGSQRYLADRFSRLYSVVLPALVFTYIIDFIGKHFNPGAYVMEIAPHQQGLRFFINATFLQEIWGFSSKPSSNGPFWSISYEFWYYMLFWVFCYFSGTKRNIGLAIVCLIIGYKILILLPVWVFGVLAYNYSDKIKLSVKSASVLFTVTLAIIICLTFFWDFSLFTDKFVFGHPPLFFSSQFVFDWIFGAIFATNLFSLTYIASDFSLPKSIESVIKYLSSVTFSLYLFHFPLLVLFGALIPYDKSSYLQTVSLLGVIVLIVCLLAAITEKQREHWKRLFGNIFSFLLPNKELNG